LPGTSGVFGSADKTSSGKISPGGAELLGSWLCPLSDSVTPLRLQETKNVNAKTMHSIAIKTLQICRNLVFDIIFDTFQYISTL